jgi:pilus assembly protein CpaB
MRSNIRGVVLLSLAVVSAFGAVLLARSALRPRAQTPAAAQVALSTVVVAGRDLPAGGVVLASQAAVREWPEAHLPAGRFAAAEEVDRRVLRRALRKEEPILESDLLPTGTEAGLTALIRDNHRAISVKVDAVVGVAGFVKPGSRVDVIATLRRVDQPGSLPQTRIILQDLRVLAIDQTLEEQDGGDPSSVNVVTLEVAPEESQKLVYAASEGSLQLALRNPSDADIERTQSLGVRDLLAGPTRAAAPAVEGPAVETVRGATVAKETL